MKKILALLILSLFCIHVQAQIPAYVPTVGLIGYWPLDGNGNDVTINANNGTVFGATSTTDRFNNPGSAYSFNGSSNYIIVANNSILSGFSDLTISFWLNLGGTNGTQSMVGKWFQKSCPGTVNGADTYLAHMVGSTPQFASNNNNINAFTSPPPSFTSSDLNVWKHFVCTSSNTSGLAIYINGVLAATHPTNGGLCTSNNPLYFGADYDGNSNIIHRYLLGKLDEIGIWNRVLNPCEIYNLYASGNGITVSSTSPSLCAEHVATLTASGVHTYTWFPGGSTGSTFTVDPLTTSTYTVIGTNTISNCSLTGTYTQQVLPAPSLSVFTTSYSSCPGTSMTFTAVGSVSYTWNSSITGSLLTVSPTVNTTYSVISTGSNGCTRDLTFDHYMLPVPAFTLNSSASMVCSGAAVTLSASGADSYTWLPSSMNGSVISVNPTAPTVYTAIGSNSFNCVDTRTIGINIQNNIIISSQASPTMVCAGDPATLTAMGGINYTWQPGGLTGSLVVVNPPVATVYTVTGDDGFCQGQSTVAVIMGQQVDIYPSGSLCNNNTIDLQLQQTFTTHTFSWSGPGITGSPTGSMVTVNLSGNYSVTVTNTLSGCTGSASISVPLGVSGLTIIPSSPVACFPGPPVNLLVSASANLNWLPAGQVSPNSGPLVSVNPSVTSTYTVIATLGSCTSTAAITITVNPVPTALNITGDTTLCYNSSTTLSASGADNFYWQPENKTGSTVELKPYVSTVYTVTGSNGNCSITRTVSLHVLPVPVLTLSSIPSQICIGHTATLTATGSPTVLWLIDSLPALSPTAMVNPTVSTTYTAIGTNSSGCQDTALFMLPVISASAISAFASSDTLCAGESVTLTASGVASYTWLPGFIFGDTIIMNPESSTAYTVTSGGGFCNYAVVPVVVTNCVNKSFGLALYAAAAENYLSDLYKIRFTAIVENTSPGDLTNVIIETDLDQTFPFPITYTVGSPPVIRSKTSNLFANKQFDGRLQKSITVSAASTLTGLRKDTIDYQLIIDPHGFKGILKASLTGYGTDKNNTVLSDSSMAGWSTDPDLDGNPANNNEPTILDIPLTGLFVPSGFSPDGDGLNDLFVIKGLNGRAADLTIFNRWGNKVYEKQNYDNSWDGSCNAGLTLGSGKLPNGVYYYVLQFKDGDKQVNKGFIVMKY